MKKYISASKKNLLNMIGLNRPVLQKVFAPDRIGIVGFNDRGFVIAHPEGPYSTKLRSRSGILHTMISGSYSNIAAGLRESIRLVKVGSPGTHRRIWLFSDGYANKDQEKIKTIVQEARHNHININVIAFGDNYDDSLLRSICKDTHNGKFIKARTLKEITDALSKGSNTNGRHNQHHHRSETTIICIDLSGSMVNPMGKKRKIDVVEEAMLHLLRYKQQCFS